MVPGVLPRAHGVNSLAVCGVTLTGPTAVHLVPCLWETEPSSVLFVQGAVGGPVGCPQVRRSNAAAQWWGSAMVMGTVEKFPLGDASRQCVREFGHPGTGTSRFLVPVGEL